MEPRGLLPAVIDAARVAGQMVAEEFARPDGPRFSDHVTAPVDHAIEMFLRDRLMTLLPARFVGEEAGVVDAPANGFCWVVDPHDGTRAFLEGKRGSAVSIALLRMGIPVIGVVHAPLCPDRGSDMIAWAEGGPITRDGAVVTIDLRVRELAANGVVFLNHGVWQRPVWNSIACAPARFMPLPSIAYRLARIAVGDGIATQTLRPVNALDIAAGHALLIAAGGVLLAEDGTPVTYNEMGESRPSACFGGAPRAVDTLLTRAWRGSTEPRRDPRITLNWPRTVPEAVLDRAAGCLLGLAIGDSLGAQVETMDAAAIARDFPGGVRDLRGGGPWGILAGQPTDDTELALTLARALAGASRFDEEAAAAAYVSWFLSEPFGAGPTTARALAAAAAARDGGRAEAARQAADAGSQTNGSLMRVAPIGIWAGSPERAAAAAMADSRLTHPHPDCTAACASLAAAIACGVAGGGAAEMMRSAADAAHVCEAVIEVLRLAASGAAPTFAPEGIGTALSALYHAFFHLAAGTPAEAALIEVIGYGGDTDTNAAITGALLGAAQGRRAFPMRWVMPVLSCRPDAGLTDITPPVRRPRPESCWPDDLIDLAEALARGPDLLETP